MTSLFELNFSASLLIISILIIRALFRNKLPKRFFAMVWGIVVLRLIIPFSVPVEIGLFPPDYSFRFIDEMNGVAAPIGFFEPDGTFNYQFGFSAADAALVRERNSVLIIVSLIISLLLMTAFTLIHLKNRKRYSDALPFENERVNAFIKTYGLRREVAVKFSDKISAPITYGILKPVIVLPKSCTAEDFENVECIIAHEIAHIRFFDVLYKWILTFVTCLFWYNPLVWLMLSVSERDIEVACDMEAVRKCGCTGETYSGLLIGLEEKRSIDIYARSFSAGAIKSRIKAVMKGKKTGVISAVIAVVLSACSFTVFGSAYTGMETALSMWIPIHIDNNDVSELLWLMPQKYYLEGGTSGQYIEVYPDNTIQVFGYDYISDALNEDKEMYEGYTEEEMADIMTGLQKSQDYWNSPHKYELLNLAAIYLENDGSIEQPFVHYTDENTFTFRNGIYKAETPWHAGVYQAYELGKEPGFGYYYSDKDDTYIYMFYDAMEIYDGKGGSSGPVRYMQVRTDENPDTIILAINCDRLSEEAPRGFILNDDEKSIYDPETGATYTLKAKPLLS